MKKLAIYSLFPMLLIGTLSLVGCGTEESYDEAYDELYALTTSFKGKASYKRVDELLNEIPEEFKDTKDIKDEYVAMRRYIVQLSEAYDLGYSESLGDTSRSSYIELYKAQATNKYWNISKFLTNVNIYKTAVFGKKWEDENESYFHWYENHGGEYEHFLSTNLPTGQKESITYTFVYKVEDDALTFSYRNVEDKEDMYKAFIVKYIGYEDEKLFVNISCLTNDRSYKLY